MPDGIEARIAQNVGGLVTNPTGLALDLHTLFVGMFHAYTAAANRADGDGLFLSSGLQVIVAKHLPLLSSLVIGFQMTDNVIACAAVPDLSVSIHRKSAKPGVLLLVFH
jgi:hypothetical protein